MDELKHNKRFSPPFQVNMPHPMSDDLFQPLTFEVNSKDGTTVYLYEETFGHPMQVIM